MKKPLLPLILGIMTVLSFGQVPMIEVGTTSIDQTLVVGDSVIVNVLITNNGNRDLEWEAERYAPDVTFTKEDYADPSLSENQDRIAPTVWLTRADEEGQFNAFTESGFSWGQSPENTEWAQGKVGTVPEEEYNLWEDVMQWPLPKMVGRDLSVYLTEYDEYIDLKYLSWTSGGNGGGFSYVRSGFAYWLDAVWVDGMPKNIEGVTIPTQTDTLMFKIQAKNLIAGNYPCAVEVYSNDPDNPVVSIDINLTVTGTPEISATTAFFGAVPIGATNVFAQSIQNNGDGDLVITSITNANGAIVPQQTTLTILPESSGIIELAFSPTSEMVYNDTLIIESNDPVTPTFELPMEGTGILPSESSVLQTPKVHTLAFGNTINDTIIVKNTGDTDLLYEIDFRIDSMPVMFAKEDYADPLQTENQDRITPDVWITRGDQQGLFNAAIEGSWDSDLWDSPKGTAWNDELTRNTTSGEYTNWNNAFDPRNGNLYDNYSLFLPSSIRYFDIEYHHWTSAAQGGGFSYTRQEVPGWITISGISGTIPAGDSIIKIVTFNANNAYAGSHMADLVITTNDPSNMEETFPLSLTITGEPEIDVTPIALNFGDVIEADTAMLMLEISNTGSSDLTISSITNDSSSVMIVDMPASVAPGMSAELMVKWVPDYIGAFLDTVFISNNDATEGMVKIPISGTGVEAPGLYLSVNSLTDTLVSGNSDVHNVVIKNTGASDLQWWINLVSDEEPVTFTKLDSADWTLAENQDRISPSIWITRKNQEGLFNVFSESGYNGGTSPSGTQWSQDRIMEMGSFSDWRSSMQWPLITNVGQTKGMRTTTGQLRMYDVTYHSWTKQGEGGGFSYTRIEIPEWIYGDAISGTIPAGDSIVYPVTLTAAERNAGVYNATIEVHTNIPGMAPAVVDAMIKVTGEPMIDVSPTSYGFGTVGIGVNSDTAMFTVANTGTDTLKISAMSTDSSVFSFDATMMHIPAGEEGMFSVVFNPMYAVTYLDTIMIVSDATNEPMLKIPVSGTGIEVGDISVMPMMLTDVVRYNDTTTYKVKVKNEGGVGLSWEVQGYPVTFTKADMADWTLEANQDRITPDVWITRQNTQGIFNIAQEASYNANAPANTLWAFGYTHELEEEDYDIWVDAVNGSAQSMVDSNISLYLPLEGLYYDVWFDSYSGGGPGGGFSYTRTGYPVWMESSDSGSVLASGDSVELTISFYSDMALIGDNTFDLTFLSDDPDEGEVVVELDFNVYSLMIDNELADIVENVGFGTEMVDFADVFSAADGDAISYIVANAYDSVATIAVTGTEITITEVGTGTTMISVRAQTESGDVAYADFTFRVNNAPIVSNPIANITLVEGFGSHTVNISNVFTDPDGDALSYEVASGSTDVVTAMVSGSSVILNEAGIGTSTITLSADDGIVATPTSTTFDVTVEEGAGVNAIDVNSFALHPNPSSGYVVVNFGKVISGEINVEVTSISGKQVYTEVFNVSTDELSLDLDILKEGLYMVEIQSLGFYEMKKLIIDK